MSNTIQVKMNGKKVNLNLDRPKVKKALAELIEACAERQYSIGDYFEHANGETYQLVRIKQRYGAPRAYLINGTTGVARNSDKIVKVEEADGGGAQGRGYTTTLPCRKDKFWDDENPGNFLDID